MPTTLKEPTQHRKTLPTTMRAAAIDEFGPPSALTLHVLPVPTAGPREILIAVHAAGVGFWDAMIRDGSWAEERRRFPQVLGTDGAGLVVGCGSGVDRFTLYDRVWAYQYANPRGGFYAEYVAVHVDHAALAPKELDMVSAGAAACTGLAALQGIDDHLAVRQGETVLIFGASGAVGMLAIQFAKRHGARVIGTASSDAAKTLVRELGADHVFDARSDDALVRLERLAPDGLDAVLALAGGDTLERCLDHVRPGGRIAHPDGVEPEPRRRGGIRTIAYDAVAAPLLWDALERAVGEARLRVPIAAVYPLERAAEAHARIERGHVLGRIALRVCESEEA